MFSIAVVHGNLNFVATTEVFHRGRTRKPQISSQLQRFSIRVPLASPCSCIAHHLLSPKRCARTRTLCTSSRLVGNAPHREGISLVIFLAPCRLTNSSTRRHVRLIGPCFKLKYDLDAFHACYTLL
jgi:hypothetical protein